MFIEETTALSSSPPLPATKLRGLRRHLDAHIRGQPHVMERAASVLTRGELGLAHPGRPKGSFLFVGPTGVGKTELANVFTGYLFDGRKPIRFDMSEYQNQSSVEKLIGQDADETGLLGRALNGTTEGTLLFDEIEKAHPLVLDLFLQMLDDASITFATGERKNLSRFYTVFTSNIGSSEVMRMTSAPMATVERTVLSRIGQQLRPELVGRITEKLVFARLGFDTQREICELMIDRERTRLRELGFTLETTGAVVEFLIRRGFHKTLGARPMRAVVERHLQDAIAEGMLANGSGCGRFVVDERNDRLVLHPIASAV
ncbi:MAG TPA: AAA family ATPase [Opitutaceae bacterium]|nr:AAA family ATPase [Lacunisphaera sp.]HWA09124.1 AAA family ATPase [Opitutaceae bacterium]